MVWRYLATITATGINTPYEIHMSQPWAWQEEMSGGREGQMDGRTDRQTDGQMDGWTDGKEQGGREIGQL